MSVKRIMSEVSAASAAFASVVPLRVKFHQTKDRPTRSCLALDGCQRRRRNSQFCRMTCYPVTLRRSSRRRKVPPPFKAVRIVVPTKLTVENSVSPAINVTLAWRGVLLGQVFNPQMLPVYYLAFPVPTRISGYSVV